MIASTVIDDLWQVVDRTRFTPTTIIRADRVCSPTSIDRENPDPPSFYSRRKAEQVAGRKSGCFSGDGR